MDQKTVVVLGPPRSGTSLTGQILHRMGIDMGNIRAADHENPTGYFEDMDLMKIQDSILVSCGKGFNGFNLPDETELMSGVQKFHSDLIDYIHKRQASSGGYHGWKTPATCWTIGTMISYIENPYVIVVLRDLTDIAESQKRYTRNKPHLYRPITFQTALQLTLQYYQHCFRFLSGYHGPVFFLSYNRLLTQTPETLKDLSAFLKIRCVSVSELKKLVHSSFAMRLFKIRKGVGLKYKGSYSELFRNLCLHPKDTLDAIFAIVKRN